MKVDTQPWGRYVYRTITAGQRRLTIRTRAISGNVIAVAVILAMLVLLAVNYAIDQPVHHGHCVTTTFSSGETDSGCT